MEITTTCKSCFAPTKWLLQSFNWLRDLLGVKVGATIPGFKIANGSEAAERQNYG